MKTNQPSSVSLLLFVLLMFQCLGCDQPISIDEEEERAKIIALHSAQRDFHFNAQAEDFVNQFSTNYRSVNKGLITQPTREESVALFQPYFDAVEFEAWDDVKPPVIAFSDDYSMAYTLVDKEVILSYPLEEGGRFNDTTHYAWTAIYRKYDGDWKIDCVTSTKQ